MSGHSHFSSIKHKKSLEDEKRGKIFSKMARVISVAAKEGPDPASNPKLRQALDEAKNFNMPKGNIERAIKRGSGETKEGKLEEVNYEAFGPGGIAVIIEAITDNKNRTLAEIKHVLQKYNGKLAESGSVKWLFERKGVISINPDDQTQTIKKEDLEMKAIEAGAEDTFWNVDENLLDIYTKTENLEKIKKTLKDQGVEFESASLDWVAKDPVEIAQKEKESSEKFFEELSENDAVQDVYSNLKD
jgi:YebC/PmpR family DNA-binding regulatory protein